MAEKRLCLRSFRKLVLVLAHWRRNDVLSKGSYMKCLIVNISDIGHVFEFWDSGDYRRLDVVFESELVSFDISFYVDN